MPLCPNTVCDTAYGETENTCPEDCRPEPAFSLGFILIVLFILVAGIGGYFYYQFKKGTKKIDKKFSPSQKRLVFDAYTYKTSPKSGKVRETVVEKQLEKSLDKAEKFFK